MDILLMYGFILLFTFGMHYTWAVKYRGGSSSRK